MSIHLTIDDTVRKASYTQAEFADDFCDYVKRRKLFHISCRKRGNKLPETTASLETLTFIAMWIAKDAPATKPLDHPNVTKFDVALREATRVACRVEYRMGRGLQTEIRCFGKKGLSYCVVLTTKRTGQTSVAHCS